MKHLRRPFAAALLLSLVAGCASLGRSSPRLELYVIGGGPPAVVAPMPGLAGTSIGVRRLSLAPYLATPSIVVRRGPHEILTSDYHRWGEDLGEGINRAVARHLAGTAAFRTVDVAPWPVRSRYDYLVHLSVSRFEGVVPAGATAAAVRGAAHVVAEWEIIRQHDDAVLARGTSEFTDGWAVGDYAALVGLMDQGLARLAADLAVALNGVAAASPGAP